MILAQSDANDYTDSTSAALRPLLSDQPSTSQSIEFSNGSLSQASRWHFYPIGFPPHRQRYSQPYPLCSLQRANQHAAHSPAPSGPAITAPSDAATSGGSSGSAHVSATPRWPWRYRRNSAGDSARNFCGARAANRGGKPGRQSTPGASPPDADRPTTSTASDAPRSRSA